MSVETKLVELITVTTNSTLSKIQERNGLQSCKKAVKKYSLETVNQFAIAERLTGLEERWRVSYDEEAADKLAEKLQALNAVEDKYGYKYKAECLHLILALSRGRPSKDYESLIEQARVTNGAHELQWSDVFSHQHSSDEEIWHDSDYASPASGSEVSSVGPVEVTRILERGKVLDEELEGGVTRSLADLEFDDDSWNWNVTRIQNTRQIFERGGSRLTESIAFRESIHMLCGLESDLFVKKGGLVETVADGELSDVSSTGLYQLLNKIAEAGSIAESARVLLTRRMDSPVGSRFQFQLQKHVQTFHQVLSQLERNSMVNNILYHSLVYLVNISSQALQSVKALMSVTHLDSGELLATDTSMLDRLVEKISEEEAISSPASTHVLDALKDCFWSCFEAFWRPILAWFEGTNPQCTGIAFIRNCGKENIPLRHMWKKGWLLDDTLSPKFLKSHLSKIFTTGKTAALLGLLTNEGHLVNPVPKKRQQESKQSAHTGLTAFKEMLDDTIKEGLLTRTEDSKGQLRTVLLEKWQLLETLESIQIVYLAKYGSANDKASTDLFKLIDNDVKWDDRFLVTDIFQRAFDDVVPTNVDQLAISIEHDQRTTHAREASLVKLEALKIHFALPWPIANLFDDVSVSIYQRVATFLLQIARARYCLNKATYKRSHLSSLRSRSGVRYLAMEHRLRWFTNILHNYIALNVLPQAATALQKGIFSGEDFDTMAHQLQESVSSLESGCLLSVSSRSSHQALISLLDLSIVLTSFSQYSDVDRDEDSYSSAGEEHDFEKPKPSDIHVAGEIDIGKLVELQNTFMQLLSFVYAGVKETARENGDTRLELFGKDLESGLDMMRR